jgi:hypothetical protein
MGTGKSGFKFASRLIRRTQECETLDTRMGLVFANNHAANTPASAGQERDGYDWGI